MIEDFEIVEVYGNCRTGGECALCRRDLPASDRVRVTAHYWDGEAYLTEPFNLCRNCYDEKPKSSELGQ